MAGQGTLVLPHEAEAEEHLFQCPLFRFLPPEVQEQCRRNVHLLRYLHALPTGQLGVPRFHTTLSRKLGDMKPYNLLYPVSEEVFIHVVTAPKEERPLYIPVEPIFAVRLEDVLPKIEERLLDLAGEFAAAKTAEEKTQALLTALEKVCKVSPGNGNGNGKGSRKRIFLLPTNEQNSKVHLTPQQFAAVKYLMVRDKVGLGVLQPMISDKYIEDISCSGLGFVFLEHKVFKSMKSTIHFATHEQLDRFVLRLSEQIKRPVTMRNPIVDAILPDGSRVNIVYGREVSQRGSNFTIRKFNETPLSIFELIEFGTLDYRMAAYLSILLEEGMNLFVSGETASGKTTALNAITIFVPPEAKIVTIEDTPEIQVPHQNWVREVAKAPRAGEKGATVTMMDLLKAALRQRPNLIIIGEIRGEEGAIAFQAMQTGHAVMATFHASTVERLIQRLTGHPINIPKTYIDNLNAVLIMSAVRLPNGKTGRRALSISEIVGYDPPSNTFSFVEVFRWDPVRDAFEFIGDKNSYLLEQKVATRRGLVGNRKWEIYNLLERRAKVLEKLHKEKGIKDYYELFRILAQARREGLF
ncbi:MAG: type II/IV secretion system ATPase subunit [Dehalococcoidia bacterium]